jgi:hypothetical protein
MIPDGHGGEIRVRGGEKPGPATVAALQELVAAAKRAIVAKHPTAEFDRDVPQVKLQRSPLRGVGRMNPAPPRSGG